MLLEHLQTSVIYLKVKVLVLRVDTFGGVIYSIMVEEDFF
jgi:hypothetical protein